MQQSEEQLRGARTSPSPQITCVSTYASPPTVRKAPLPGYGAPDSHPVLSCSLQLCTGPVPSAYKRAKISPIWKRLPLPPCQTTVPVVPILANSQRVIALAVPVFTAVVNRTVAVRIEKTFMLLRSTRLPAQDLISFILSSARRRLRFTNHLPLLVLLPFTGCTSSAFLAGVLSSPPSAHGRVPGFHPKTSSHLC